MEEDNGGLHADEENQRVRSTKKVKMNGVGETEKNITLRDREKEGVVTSILSVEEKPAKEQQGPKVMEFTSYKNMLLGVNGDENDYSSDDLEMWKDGMRQRTKCKKMT